MDTDMWRGCDSDRVMMVARMQGLTCIGQVYRFLSSSGSRSTSWKMKHWSLLQGL